ncbi:MAG: P22 phage major capsid protein family protein [Desulfuromonadaceae bacterium]
MANQFKTSKKILQIAAIELYNALKLGKVVTMYGEEKYKAPGMGALGPSVDVPMPIRYLAKDGATFQGQSITETTKTVTLDQHKHVGLDMSVFDMTLNTEAEITKVSSKFIRPAILTLADSIDDYIAGLGTKLHQTAGTAGQTPGSGTAAATQQALADAKMIMVENGVTQSMTKNMILNPKAAGYIPTALSALFVREAQEAVKTGRLGHLMDLNMYESNNIRKHTSGTLGAGAQYDETGSGGTTLVLQGLDASDSLVVGDTITIAGVYAVNPVNKRTVSSDRLMQFIVTTAGAEAGNAMTVTISPEPIATGAYQNVSAAPVEAAAVTVKAAHVANMVITKDTLVLATMPFKKPMSATIAETITYEGISLLLTAGYDVSTMTEKARIDILFGGRELYPETGVRLLG